jgi:hypothetical protein
VRCFLAAVSAVLEGPGTPAGKRLEARRLMEALLEQEQEQEQGGGGGAVVGAEMME